MNLILPPPVKEEIDKTGYLGQEKKEAVGA